MKGRVEVSPRDGLQNEARPIATEEKVALIDTLSRAGFPPDLGLRRGDRAKGARLGSTQVVLGLIPAADGPYVAVRLGPAARRVFFTFRLFGAEEAAELGLLAWARTRGSSTRSSREVAPCLKAVGGAVASAKLCFAGCGSPWTKR